MSFWEELRRRNVFKVGAAYALIAFIIAQIVDLINVPLQLPDWFDTTVLVFLGIGFPIALLFAWAYELTPEGVKRTSEVTESESITRITGQRINYAVISLLALALVLVVLTDGIIGDSDTTDPTSVQSTSTEISERSILPNSVAVLPLQNLSPGPENAFYANGMHDAIISQLTKLRSMSVIDRNSVLQYAENRPPPEEIAAALGVESLLVGTFQYVSGQIRVAMQLVDPHTRVNLWSEEYQADFADVFAVQADIAMNVANALKAQFSDEERQRLEREPTSSPVAYQLYLQARSLIGIGEQAPRMHELLDQAIAIDSGFALAYGFKAALYAQDLINTSDGSARSPAELEPLIREYAEKALALDAETAVALNALGNLASYSWRWTEAKEAYERAYEINNVAGPPASTWFRAWSGDPAEALRIAARWVELSPLDWISHWTHGIVLNYAGDYDAAAAKLRDGIALAPALSAQRSWLATTEVALGNIEGARREFQLAEQLAGQNIISLIDAAYGYGRIGDSADARRLFDEISAVAEGGQDIGAGGWALIHLAVGQTDEALEWLETGAEKAGRRELDAGYYSLMNVKMNYTDDPVLEQPEFVDVRNRIRGD